MNLFDAETRALYTAEIDACSSGSLTTIFRLVPDAVDVLDVGIGSGALGQRLAAERGCRVDGVTISTEEAAQAQAFYRRIEVADLNAVGLDALFQGQRYDVIVCADVLEHLARPTQVLDACRALLADDGVLLISIPNVAYVGLLGELLAGEFRYRMEGLLDRTHLRFFTRRSLLRMMDGAGWQVEHLEAVKLDLPDSEFRVNFDGLPPAMQRHLLAMPDALSYQFVIRARARPAAGQAAEIGTPLLLEQNTTVAEAPRFSALLYLKDSKGFVEDRKFVAQGRIGTARQRLQFVFPAQERALTGLRLDPADRPGFLHLFGFRLFCAAGALIWQWDGEVEALAACAHQQVLFRVPLFSQSGTVLLLTGDDPHFELPLQAEQLRACQAGGVLEVELGWPMSADYPLFVDELTQRQQRIEVLEANVALLTEQRRAVERRADELTGQLESAQQYRSERDALAAERDVLAGERDLLIAEVDRLRTEIRTLGVDGEALREELSLMKNTVERQRSVSEALTLQLDHVRGRLQAIESAPLFRKLSPWLRLPRNGSNGEAAVATATASDRASLSRQASDLSASVDIIVPVYKGLDETRLCLESVLGSSPATPFRLVIVNDASPQPEITAYLRELQHRDSRVELIENAVNNGFVASVNKAMQFSRDRDVVLLNSDAEVAGDWLDRLRRPAQTDAHVGTVTPFSNSATICSYPKFCVDNGLPADSSTETLDRLFASANAGRTLPIPTAVGFCMFIRRSCLNSVGLFDTKRFGRGYGEENDFCMRARKSGWGHVMALDVFVHHTGGVSFGDEKARRVAQAQEILARLHPEYAVLVHKHVAEDPARSARLAVDVARLRGCGLPSVLCVIHNTGGGTERHVRELSTALHGQANVLALRPAPGGETILEWLRHGEGFQLGFRLPDEYETLVAVLKSLAVGLVHYHHLLGHSPAVWGLPKSLGVRHDFTAHDFYSICPQITLTDQNNRYCGERGVEQCNTCLLRSPPPGGVSIDTWRAGYRPIIESSRFVFTPSAEAAARVRRYFPAANILHVSHSDMAQLPPAPAPMPIADGRPLRIVVLGALSPIKGADVLEATAIEAASRGLPLEFHLLGFGYRSLQKQPKARLTVHGQYEDSELSELLAWLKPDIAWFPALWPETYSYTLSGCLKAGLPIVGPDFGAFPERLHGRAWTWLCPWGRSAAEWVDFFERVRTENFVSGTEPEKAVGLAVAPADFTYRRDYLEGVGGQAPGPALTHEMLERHRPGNRAATVTKHSKRVLLSLAVRLRNQSLLRGLVRRVPLRWQTRAKVWLST